MVENKILRLTESELIQIIKEVYFKSLVSEQPDSVMDRRAAGVRELAKTDPHTLLSIFAIGSVFIPVVGPFISATLGLADASLYYRKGDKKSAGIVAVFSMLPFISRIPGVKELGSKGMAKLAQKLSMGGKNLTKAEAEIANAIKNYSPYIQKELSKMGPKLKPIVKELDLYKPNYIKKYGEQNYNNLLSKFLYDGIDEKTFIQTLKNVKTPNIKLKPVLGGGGDHRVFQSVTNPNQIFKAELRPGEVDKWYDTFRKYPDLFAKTFKKAKVKDSNGKILNAVVMEKLNTASFMKLWDDIEKILYDIQKSLPSSERVSTLEFLLKNLNKYPKHKSVWSNVLKRIKNTRPNMFDKVSEFNNVINKFYKVTPTPDIRKFNLGYDEKGVLKVLDL